MALDTKRLIGIALGGPMKSKGKSKLSNKSSYSEPDNDELEDDEDMVDEEFEDDMEMEDEPSDEELDSELPGDPLLTKERLRCADDAFKAIDRGDRRAFVEAILAIADTTEY